jgi:copper(I)-binding protein
MLLTRTQLPFLAALAMALLSLGGCSAPTNENAPYTVSNASIRTPVAGRTTTAAYFEFTNNSDAAVKIIGVSSTAAERVEMHTIIKVDDQMRMRPLPEIAVPARDKVVFARGGNHLMLFGVQLTDTPAILEIELDNGESIAAPFQQTRLN